MARAMRICLAQYKNPATGSSIETWQEVDGSIVMYVDGNPVPSSLVNPASGVYIRQTWVGTSTEYDAIDEKDPFTQYIITEEVVP